MIDQVQFPQFGKSPEIKGRPAENTTKTRAGFTLVELMVAMALGIFLIGGLLLTYGAGRSASLQAESLSRVQENIRFANDFIIRDVRNAGFRDNLVLTGEQFTNIEENFASIEVNATGNQQLVVRYAGQGSCGRAFQDEFLPRIVENRYFAEEGNLFCKGTEFFAVSPAESFDPIQLAVGIKTLTFTFRDATGQEDPSITQCDFTDDQLESACIGVTATITFEDDPPRQVQLVAAFRNVIVDRVYGR